MILSWTADQHRGQAKGKSPLAKLYRTVHIEYWLLGLGLHLQKIASRMPQKRDLYQHLVCMEHRDWDGTLQMIQHLGGKAAQGILLLFRY
jgi:hypothetical protein